MAEERKFFGSKKSGHKSKAKKKAGTKAKPFLPEALIQHTLFGYLDPDTAATLAVYSDAAGSMPEYQEAFDVTLKKLLQHTAKAEAKEALAMAKLNYALIINKGAFTEQWCGQRQWQEISPLEYAAWAGDTELVDGYLNCLRDSGDDKAKRRALRQLEKVRRGWSEDDYHLAPVYKLISLMEDYDRQYEHLSREARDDYWINKIGKAQLCSVVNLLQWYCGSAHLNENTNFNQPLLHILKLYSASEADTLDLSRESRLGEDFALLKLESLTEAVWGGKDTVRQNCKALKHFCETRRTDLARQIAQLESDLKVEARQGPEKKSSNP